MRIASPVARLGAAILPVLLVALPAAARKPRVLDASAAPSWLREAAKIEVPGNLTGAGTVLLLDELRVEPLAEGGVRLARRQVRRVLTADGLQRAGTLGFNYSEGDRVEEATLWNMTPDGGLRRPDPKEDERDVAWSMSGNLVDDSRYRQVAVPGCRVGSVVGAEWTIVRELDIGAVIESYGHATRPVGRCRIELHVPAGWTFEDQGERADAFTRTDSDRGVTWEAPGLDPLPREEFPLPPAERLPRIALRWFSPDGSRGFADWDAVSAWYRELAESTLKDAGESVRLAGELQPMEGRTIEMALREAFLFCARDVRYVSVQLGIGGFRPATPARTCSQRYGDCKAKSFLMRSIVERWGLESHAVLVRTSPAGKVMRGVPTPGQFNHCVVAVQLPEGVRPEAWNTIEVKELGRLAILDPTTTALGPWDLREDVQGTLGLLVTPTGGHLLELPVQPPEESRTHWDLQLGVDPTGNVLRGDLVLTVDGTEAAGYRLRYGGRTDIELRRFAETLAQEFAPGCRLEEHVLTGLESTDGPLQLRLAFTGGRVGQTAGDILIVDAPLRVAPISSSALPAGELREPLWLGLPRQRQVALEIQAPDGWGPEALPAGVAMDTAWFGVEGSWELLENGYRFTGLGSLEVREIAPSDYPAFREALRSVSSALGEGVVLVMDDPG